MNRKIAHFIRSFITLRTENVRVRRLTMFIEVELYDGDLSIVSPEGLERLIENNLAKRFRRTSGWAVVGANPIRSNAQQLDDYDGYERRHADRQNRTIYLRL
jgi:hypothetical protein